MAYKDTLKNISNVSGIVGNALNSATNILGNSDTSPQSIKDKILGGFLGNTTQFKPSVFSRLFDEPTYLTFRIEFNFDDNREVNKYDSTYTTFNYMPEPLFDMGSSYSTVHYLENALGEKNRANILTAFINGLKDIQTNYSYYFQSIEGLETLMSINSEYGMRLNPEENTITIKCLEGLDMKINGLMQMYRKVAWDDYFQRWVLPDMMRYFNMKIYISEIRLFHSMSESLSHYNKSMIYDLTKGDVLNATSQDALKSNDIFGTISKALNAASGITSRYSGTNSTAAGFKNAVDYGTETVTTIGNISTDINMIMRRMCNNAINDVMPTICIDCRMCEFDISNSLDILSNLITTRPESPTEGTIKIKVGQVFDTQFYPLNSSLSIVSGANGESYKINANNPYYLDDTLFLKDEFLSENDPAYKTNRITKTIFRVNPNVDANSNKTKDLSYRVNRASVDNTLQLTTNELLHEFVKTSSKAIENGNNVFNKSEQALKGSKKTSTAIDEAQGVRTGTNEPIPLDLLSKEDREKYKNRGSAAIDEAATDTLTEIANEIKNNKEIESTALSDEQKSAIKNLVMTSVLENIAKSTATEETKPLIDLANTILNEHKRSSATTKRSINNFEYLNK